MVNPWFAFLKTQPTHPQAEDYIKAHATRLHADTIAGLNAHVVNFERPERSTPTVPRD